MSKFRGTFSKALDLASGNVNLPLYSIASEMPTRIDNIVDEVEESLPLSLFGKVGVVNEDQAIQTWLDAVNWMHYSLQPFLMALSRLESSGGRYWTRSYPFWEKTSAFGPLQITPIFWQDIKRSVGRSALTEFVDIDVPEWSELEDMHTHEYLAIAITAALAHLDNWMDGEYKTKVVAPKIMMSRASRLASMDASFATAFFSFYAYWNQGKATGDAFLEGAEEFGGAIAFTRYVIANTTFTTKIVRDREVKTYRWNKSFSPSSYMPRNPTRLATVCAYLRRASVRLGIREGDFDRANKHWEKIKIALPVDARVAVLDRDNAGTVSVDMLSFSDEAFENVVTTLFKGADGLDMLEPSLEERQLMKVMCRGLLEKLRNS
jgi:hypothetical protein